MLIRINAVLRKVPRWAIVAGSLATTFAVAWMDYQAGSGLQIAVFYLPPIVAVAWHLGRTPGVAYAVFTTLLLSVLAEQTVELRALAREDPLTGIPNRRAFFGALDRAVEWSRRQGMSWVLAYLDVDNFKRINDTLGHAAGEIGRA